MLEGRKEKGMRKENAVVGGCGERASLSLPLQDSLETHIPGSREWEIIETDVCGLPVAEFFILTWDLSRLRTNPYQ